MALAIIKNTLGILVTVGELKMTAHRQNQYKKLKVLFQVSMYSLSI